MIILFAVHKRMSLNNCTVAEVTFFFSNDKVNHIPYIYTKFNRYISIYVSFVQCTILQSSEIRIAN